MASAQSICAEEDISSSSKGYSSNMQDEALFAEEN